MTGIIGNNKWMILPTIIVIGIIVGGNLIVEYNTERNQQICKAYKFDGATEEYNSGVIRCYRNIQICNRKGICYSEQLNEQLSKEEIEFYKKTGDTLP